MSTPEERDPATSTPAGSAAGRAGTMSTSGGKILGTLHDFRPEVEQFAVYLERVNIFFAVNDIKPEKKVPVLLNAIGATTYAVLRNLLAPANPLDKSFEEVTEKLVEHFDPKPLIVVERYHFHKREQASGESLVEYVAELRRLAAKCNFGAYLEDALRDRFVCGIRSEHIQRGLLAEADLDLAKAIKKATAMEAAHTHAQVLKSPPLAVGRVDRPIRDRQASQGSSKPCHRCGISGHHGGNCRFQETHCHTCGKRGHLARVCRSATKTSRGRSQSSVAYQIEGEPQVGDEEDLILSVNSVGRGAVKPYQVVLEVNNKPITMEIDTGAAVTLISQRTREALFPEAVLLKPSVKLRTYTKQPIKVEGQIEVSVKHNGYEGKQLLYVVRGNGPSLLGRSWLSDIRLDWGSIKQIHSQAINATVETLLDKYAMVFKDTPGVMGKYTARLKLKPGVQPVFRRPRPVPFAIRDVVGKALDRLEECGVLRRVEHAEWAAPIVPVPKGDGTLRLCGDYKMTINPHLYVDQYPLPRPTDLMASLTGGKYFTKLDLRSAYQQMPLDTESAKMVTINTHQGLYEYTKLPFGVSSAPAIFQRAMDAILQGLPRVICYLDDILITGKSEREHWDNVEEVLRRLKNHGVTLKREKCVFFQPSVEYLGRIIDAQGVHTSYKKVQAVLDAPAPRNVHELRSTLGMIIYYAKFIPDLSNLLHPLHTLLKSRQQWKWTDACEKAFKNVKKSLTQAPVLAHYDPDLPLILAADASAYGLGAVISHKWPDGTERPIAYASRTLTDSEKNYPQIEKEALSLIYGIKKFHEYVYGCRFTLVTDHQPLTSILGPKKGIPPLAAARMQRWALLLSAYTYDICYRTTKAHANADGLSRIPLDDKAPLTDLSAAQVFNLQRVNSLPVQASEVATATRSDPLLSKILQYIRKGWALQVATSLIPYSRRREELTTEGDCILWGGRVVIPEKLQSRVLQELHKSHPGVVRMKQLARSHVWWPNLDKHLEEVAKTCTACQEYKHAPPRAPLHPWPWPTTPWERVHVDFLGPFMGRMILVAMDAHSKWPEAHIMSSTTTAATVNVLREIFARNGIPKQLVSDNGPQFVSEQFHRFMADNGVEHIRIAAYHPASNGAAERFVQTIKKALRVAHQSGMPLEQALMAFLLRYRTTPHATTGVAPCTLFCGRTLRTRLDLITPNVGTKVQKMQQKQKEYHDLHSKYREFQVGQRVWTLNFRNGPRWKTAIVFDRLGPVSYLVQLEGGELWRRHVDQLRGGSGVADYGREEGTASFSETCPSVAEEGEKTPPCPGLSTEVPTSASGTEEHTSSTLENTHHSVGEPRPQSYSESDRVPGTATNDPNMESDSGPVTAAASARYPKRSRQKPDRLYGTLKL